MGVLHEIVHALWHQDFAALANPEVVWIVYSVMFMTLFLENGLLPASFLPGDSLLLLAGAMVAKGVMDFSHAFDPDHRRQSGLLAELPARPLAG